MKVTQDRGRDLGSSPSSVTNLKGGCHLSDPQTLFSANGNSKMICLRWRWCVHSDLMQKVKDSCYRGRRASQVAHWKNPLEWRRLKRCHFSPQVGKIPWRKKWQLAPGFLPGKYHEQKDWWVAARGAGKSQTRLSD